VDLQLIQYESLHWVEQNPAKSDTVKLATEYFFRPLFNGFPETMRRGNHQQDGNTDNAQEKEDPEDPSRNIAQ
jgi:hypothetical protein